MDAHRARQGERAGGPTMAFNFSGWKVKNALRQRLGYQTGNAPFLTRAHATKVEVPHLLRGLGRPPWGAHAPIAFCIRPLFFLKSPCITARFPAERPPFPPTLYAGMSLTT